jgi:hypothetical protein
VLGVLPGTTAALADRYQVSSLTSAGSCSPPAGVRATLLTNLGCSMAQAVRSATAIVLRPKGVDGVKRGLKNCRRPTGSVQVH